MSNGNNWSNFTNYFIAKRFYESQKSPAYVFYFIIIIIALGCLGLWTDLKGVQIRICGDYDETKLGSIIANLSGISLTLISSCVVEFLFIKKENIEPNVRRIDIQSFGLASLVGIFLLYMFAQSNNKNSWGLLIAICSILYTWWFWWIANARNKVLGLPANSKPPKYIIGEEESIGKNLSKNTLKGSFEGFKNG